ncbi:hypothetical protein BSN82_17865, partial [Acinetobacter baylyi]|uniref:hypothetical protein n=1 Tax=Acinetobacter baylyi TaxID=202950 RepID=UPI001C09D74F
SSADISSMLVLSLSGCGLGDGRYRYPCQDPKNWETADCKPPVCEVNGYCPVDLVGEDIFNGTSSDGETVTGEGQNNG